jgi:sortase A
MTIAVFRWLERLLMIVGVACLAWVATTWIEAERFQRAERRVLDDSARVPAHTTRTPTTREQRDDTGPIGRLDIPRLGVSVVVMPGDDDATLSRAVGHLSDTPLPWDGGNTALAGHRDTFFRPLERIKAGDDVYLDTSRGRFHYRVRRTIVVKPEDLWVLDPSANATLTLITCFPFHYIGSAPQRFVVQADRV